ncbi:hypothetical protein DFH11DRAFT_1168433 [Phellopilus nigrolimitatus]|nr:hypothetical protein DFH11DRAFT_1168433 [Phellopilus nigrolimitatus]
MFNGERMVSTSDLSMIDSDLASLDSVSTNATADNLPGPGRTLGLFYSSAGRHLEVQLGKIAGRLGRGPQATAVRIKKNSEVVTFVSVLPLPISMVKFKAKKIEKDCKLLLRYVGSNALSTKGQALDHIIDLSLDHHVRGLLKAMGAVHLIKRAKKEIFLRDDYDASILSRSHKALVSVADDTFMQDIKDLNESHMRIFNRTLNVWAYVRYVNSVLIATL